MRRRLIRSALLIAAIACCSLTPAVSASSSSAASPILKRFFAIDENRPIQYRAFRHLQARNDKLNASAWMDVWTDADASGFRYRITGEGGSGYIRSHVFTPALETERDMWDAGPGGRGTISAENYEFGDCGDSGQTLLGVGFNSSLTPPGLVSDIVQATVACVGLKPRRKDVLLVDGAIFLKPDDGDLVRIQGSLSKNPSFWTRRVDIVRHYQRIGGVRLPVALESVASLRVAGTSTFTVTYQYESVNGRQVGN